MSQPLPWSSLLPVEGRLSLSLRRDGQERTLGTRLRLSLMGGGRLLPHYPGKLGSTFRKEPGSN